ncbi:MAG: LysR family transcriptional regulator [Geobacter sp.]|nr:MAG: LysR family transcriptional regulator [Geobacter sp.]
METCYLKTLLIVAETGSFSKAAHELHVSQSAVSQRVKFLEDRYGHQLLDRSSPQLTATEVGSLVIRKAEKILGLELELQEEIRQVGRENRLALSCTPAFGIAYLPGMLNRFMRQNSDVVDFKFIFSTPEQAIRGLQERTFDVGVIEHCGDLEMCDFKTHTLPQDELVFISSPELGIPEGHVPVEALLGHLLFTRKEGCSSRKLLTKNMVSIGRTIHDFVKVLIYDDLRLTVQSVMGGEGVSFVSRSLVKDQLLGGQLREHRVDGFCHNRLRTVAINRKRALDPTLKMFVECIFATLPQHDECSLNAII